MIHVWPYENLGERTKIRAEAANDPNWPPKSDGLILNMESEIFTPAEFMRPLGGDQALGNIYEMRTYTYQPGTMGEVLKRWAAAIPHREEYSPLAAGMSSELGGLNKWMHVWPYKDLEERNKIRAEASTNPTGRRRPGSFWSGKKTRFASRHPSHPCIKLSVRAENSPCSEMGGGKAAPFHNPIQYDLKALKKRQG